MSASEAEERAQFTLAMRARGIDDLSSCARSSARRARSSCRSGSPTFQAATSRCRSAAGRPRRRPRSLAAMIAALGLSPSRPGLRNRNRNRLLHGFARPACEASRVARAVPDAGARGLGPDQGLRSRQCRGALGGRVRAFITPGERFDKVIVHGLIEPPARAFLQPDRAGRRAGRGLRRARTRRAAHRPTDRAASGARSDVAEFGPARGLRPLERGLARAL